MKVNQSQAVFQSNGLTMHGTLAIPEFGNKLVPGVIIFHGMTSSEQGYIPLAIRLAEAGVAGLAISMRGHGQSEGDFNKEIVAEATQDAVSAYDFLVKQPGIDADRVGMVGSSVGAILAGMATTERDVKSLVFRAPAAYTTEMMRLSMAETMTDESRQFYEIDDLTSTPAGAATEKFKGCLLVVASEHDAIIPLSVSRGYIDVAKHATSKRLTIIEGAPHTLSMPRWKEAFTRETLDWFGETLKDKK